MCHYPLGIKCYSPFIYGHDVTVHIDLKSWNAACTVHRAGFLKCFAIKLYCLFFEQNKNRTSNEIKWGNMCSQPGELTIFFCELAYLPGLMINNNPRVVFVARLTVGSHLDAGRFENLSSCLCSSGCSGRFSVVVVVVVCSERARRVLFKQHCLWSCALRICLCRCFASSDILVNDRIQSFPSRMLDRRDMADIVKKKNASRKFITAARVSPDELGRRYKAQTHWVLGGDAAVSSTQVLLWDKKIRRTCSPRHFTCPPCCLLFTCSFAATWERWTVTATKLVRWTSRCGIVGRHQRTRVRMRQLC